MTALWQDRETLSAPVIARTRRENPVIDAAIAADEADTTRHVLEHFRALLSLPTPRLAALGGEPLAFVQAHGVRRARAGVPLLAVLQAYRTGHKGFWAALCAMINRFAEDAETALRTTMLLSDYCIEYTDLISIAVTDAYLAEEALLAAHRTRLSIAVLEELLRGEPPRSIEALDHCARAGIGYGRPMVMLVARKEDAAGAAPFSADERGTLARAIDNALPQATFGRLVELRLDEVVAVISCAERPGKRAAEALRAQVAEAADFPAGSIQIGIGLDVIDISELPRSYREAGIAIALLGAGQPVAHLADAQIDAYLRHNADTTARSLTIPGVEALQTGELIATLHAFARASLNVKACAAILNVHNNTVYHRLNAVRRLTGVDPRTYSGLSNLLAALSVAAAPAGACR